MKQAINFLITLIPDIIDPTQVEDISVYLANQKTNEDISLVWDGKEWTQQAPEDADFDLDPNEDDDYFVSILLTNCKENPDSSKFNMLGEGLYTCNLTFSIASVTYLPLH